MTSRFENLRGLIPEELMEALDREVLHPDPLESNAEVAQTILDAAKAASDSLVVGAVSNLQSEIAQTADDANAALSSEVGNLNSAMVAGLAVAKSESESLVAGAVSDLGQEIAQTADDADAALSSEVGNLNSAMVAGLAVAKSESESLVAGAVSDLLYDISDAKVSANAALASEVSNLNDRIGKLYEVDTADATPTLLASITPSQFKSVRVIAKIHGQRLNRLEAAAYTIEALCRALPSTDDLLFNSNPLATETVTIGTTVYTFVAAPAVAFDVDIGGTAEASLDNLIAAINLTGTAGVDYHIDTTVHPDFTAEKAAGGATPSMDIAAKVPGTGSNGTVVSETIADVLSVWTTGAPGATAGGSDMTVNGITASDDHQDDATWDKAIAANGVDVEIKVQGAALTVVKWVGEIRVVEFV